MTNEYDILISYCTKDSAFADDLARRLAASETSVWLDRWNISPGEMVGEAIYSGLLNSSAVAVCIGPETDQDLSLDLLLKSHKKNPSQIILPILLRGAAAANVPEQIRRLGIPAAADVQAENTLFKLVVQLVAMKELPAATYLLQESLDPLQKKGGIFEDFKGLFSRSLGSEVATANSVAQAPRTTTPEYRDDKALIELAKQILRGHAAEAKELLNIAGKLKRAKQFGYARRILARARREPSIDTKLRLVISQQLALCTYKDPDLPLDGRLDRALDVLYHIEDIAVTVNQETLGLAGAIYKRKWEVDNQKQQLERSLNYYLRGYEQGPVGDQGYTGINAAYVLDLLAHQEEEEARKTHVASPLAEHRRSHARRIRKDILEQVAPLVDQQWLQGQWWFYTTIAEAYFGLADYDNAIKWLRRGKDDGGTVPAWEYESTARQLAALARLQGNEAGQPGQAETDRGLAALCQFFEEQEVRSAYAGKIGLGLSGGGFRAALYHIGVLARLAELDVLRSIEVISCVSGGSIIGAHYYLEVRKLLQSKPDDEITREDYLDIVARVRKDFLAGVQRNIRTRVALNPLQTIKMIFTSKYSRTMRAGELYESEIFSRVNDDGGTEPRWLNGLYVCPVGSEGKPDQDFNLKTDNWRRRAKVPNLILNTAALNTGHNWQFTASWMGEPPASIDDEIDGNDRLRRLYYNAEDTPRPYQQIRLGHAVAASACVPGLFEPLPMAELYPERIVRLVDGGVCDNQGTASLLEQDCNVILVSDGSGQMESENEPGNGLLSVPLRSNSILQARVREAQYRELSARKRASLLRGFMFVHLKQDLNVDPIDWIGCLDPYDPSDDSHPAQLRGPLTRYGIAKNIQQLLAGVRTDLDSFSDLEAFALMTSGYRMTEHQFKFSNCVEGFPEPREQYRWDFLAVEDGMRGSGAKYDYLKQILSVSNSLAFKVWKLSKPLKIASWLLAIAAIVFAIWASFHWAERIVVRQITVGGLARFIAGILVLSLISFLIGKTLMRIAKLRDTLVRVAIGIVISLLGWFFALIHLHLFDPLFLRRGSITSFMKKG